MPSSARRRLSLRKQREVSQEIRTNPGRLQLLVSLWNRRAVRIILALSVVGCSVAIVSAIYQNHQPAEATQQTGPTSLVRPGVSLIK
jgi:hypothetical protein